MKKKGIAMLLVLSMLAGTLAGCSSGSQSSAGSSSGTGTGSTGAQASGSGNEDTKSDEPIELTIGVASQFTTLDPGLNTETINSNVLRHICAGLFTKDDAGNVQPDLADGYTVSDDGLTYTVTLKDGLQWSDGEPLVAEDFVYAVKRNLTYGAENAWATNYVAKYLVGAADYANNSDLEASDLTDFTGIEAPDEKTVVYHLTRPCAFFTTLLMNQVFMPLREDFVEPHGSEWAVDGGYPSVGAYILEECNENEKAVIVKNDLYYDAENVTVDKMTYLVMLDRDAQEASFKVGDLDIALGVNTTVADSYEDPDAVWILPSDSVYFIAINSGETGPEVLKDVNIRRALALAIDKEVMSENMGQLYPVINGYVPTGMQGAEKDFREEGDEMEKFLEYDLESAKALLAEAGYNESNPLHLTYKYSNSSIHADIAQLLQQQWKNAGVDVELVAVESGVFYDQLDSGDFELARYGYSSAIDPSYFLELWSTGMQIVPAVSDSAYDQMLDDASYIVDTKEYMQALHDAERYLVEEMVYVIPLFNYTSAALRTPGMEGIICPPGNQPVFSKIYYTE